MPHDAPLPGVDFTPNDMLEWLSLDGWERVREIQVSGRGEDHGHLRHCCTDKEMTVLEAVGRYFGIPDDVGRLLIQFGAVHCARIPPEIPACAVQSLDESEGHDELRRRAKQLVIDRGELENLSQAQRSRILLSKTDRVLDERYIVRQFSYVRAHLWPKRFPLFHSVDWRDRIVAVGDDYVVVNKPSGVPVPSTVDNVLENVQAGAAKALGVPVDTLHITSRIDQPTEGLVVVGRSKAFVSRFNAAMRGFVAKKFYRAAAWVHDGADVQGLVGDVRHRVLLKHKAPGTPYVTLVCDGLDGAEAVEDQTVECHLVIRSVRVLEDGDHCLTKPTQKSRLHELEIELVTGRTHQIRCQLSSLGLPLVGDDMYEALVDRSFRERLLSDPDGFDNVREDGTRVLREPEIAIGLQAFRLEFEGTDVFTDRREEERVVFEAGAPWWSAKHQNFDPVRA